MLRGQQEKKVKPHEERYGEMRGKGICVFDKTTIP
jgi:hypothetical protein